MSGTDSPGQPTKVTWLDSHEYVAIALAFLLLTAYVAPVLIISVVAWSTDRFQEDSFWFAWFAAFLSTSDSTLNLFHKVLLPILTAVSVIAFRGKLTKAMVALLIFIICAFVTSVFVGVVFDMPQTVAALKGLADPIDPRLVRAFFTRIEESLMMYFMLLLGLGIANSSK